jgi:hypothetical protein
MHQTLTKMRAGLCKNATTMGGKSVYDTGVYTLHSKTQVGHIASNEVKACMHKQHKEQYMRRINREDLYLKLPKTLGD